MYNIPPFIRKIPQHVAYNIYNSKVSFLKAHLLSLV